jgi:hypothetical protein
MDVGDAKEKAGGLLGGLKDKVADVAGKIDDAAEGMAEKDGLLGKIGGAVHNVADKLDGDN